MVPWPRDVIWAPRIASRFHRDRPSRYPVLPELAEILSAHRARLEAAAVENPDLTRTGYIPSHGPPIRQRPRDSHSAEDNLAQRVWA